MGEADSRTALLEAAWEITIESFGLDPGVGGARIGPSAKVLDQLTTAEVASRAGLTTGAFYNRWPTRADFLDDFLDFALSIDRYPGPDELVEIYMANQGQPLQEIVDKLVRHNLAALEASPTTFVQVHLWSFARERSDIAERLRGLHEELRNRMLPFYETILEFMGREYRPPFTAQSVSMLLNAMTWGFVEQRVVGGDEAVPAEVLVNAMIALVPVVTRRKGDPATLNGVVSQAFG